VSLVVVERTFPEAVTFDSVQAIVDRGAWCFEVHGARVMKSYFSRDRRRMICVYQAPDTDSVRLAQQKAGVPFDRAWPARFLPFSDPEPADEAVIVERTLLTAIDEPAVRDIVARGEECHTLWGCRLVGSYLATDGGRLLCIYAAPDTESVRQAQRGALPLDRAWPSTIHRPPSANR